MSENIASKESKSKNLLKDQQKRISVPVSNFTHATVARIIQESLTLSQTTDRKTFRPFYWLSTIPSSSVDLNWSIHKTKIICCCMMQLPPEVLKHFSGHLAI